MGLEDTADAHGVLLLNSNAMGKSKHTHTHDPTRTQSELACIQMQMQLTNLRCTLGIYSLMQRAFSFNVQGSVQPLTCRCAPPTQRRYENV